MDQVDESTVVQAQPETRVSKLTTWRHAAKRRDDFYQRLQSTLKEHSIDALVTRSANGTYPVWVRLEAWLPAGARGNAETDPRIRTEMMITIDIRPFHESSLVISASATNGRRSIAVSNRPAFSEPNVEEWALFTLNERGLPSNYTPVVDAIATLFLSFIPFARGPHSNRVRRTFRDLLPVTLPFVLLLLGGGMLFIGASAASQPYGGSDGAMPAILIGIAMLIVAILIYRRRKLIISVIEHPDIPPRELLISIDSWHAIIPNLGARFDTVKDRILARLQMRSDARITTEIETYGFRAPNGYEERDRFVVSKGQGVAHVHIYHFGDDVFVGWDSYLNWAKWGETGPVSAQASMSEKIEYRSLQAQVYVPNQFDMIDLNSLSEVVHRDVTDTVKALMKEYEIDQEIDFQIIRGDRDNALDKDLMDRRRSANASAGKDSGGASGTRAWSIS